jgi:hypothetical protein
MPDQTAPKLQGIPMLLRGVIEECEPRIFPERDGKPARVIFELNVFVKKVGYFKVNSNIEITPNEDQVVDISCGVSNDSYASAKQPRLQYLAHRPVSVSTAPNANAGGQVKP